MKESLDPPDGSAGRMLVISDNLVIVQKIAHIAESKGASERIRICCSPRAPESVREFPGISEIDVTAQAQAIARDFGLVVSAHCKQLFPAALTRAVECVNIHPGFNPETRGWFPQVWAILYGLRVGFTVHRIDERLDHGEIIHREEVEVHSWDTSASVYARVLQAELEWLEVNFNRLLNRSFTSRPMESEGRLFLRRDFEALLELDLGQSGTMGELINRLRALTFPGYRNAYYVDRRTGRRVYVSVQLDSD